MANWPREPTLSSLLRQRAAEHPRRTWLIFEDVTGGVKRWSFAEFDDAVACVAAGLAAQGVGAGDTVTIHLPNCPEYLIAYFAIARLGAVVVLSNLANRREELRYILRHSEAKAVVYGDEGRELIQSARVDAPSVRRLVRVGRGRRGGDDFENLLSHAPVKAPSEPANGDPVVMIFTSGTTARPKAVVATHANCLTEGARSSRALALGVESRLLCVTPLFHVHALSGVFSALTAGATLVLLEKYSATRFWDQVRQHRVTHSAIVGTILRTLLAQPEDAGDRNHTLTTLISTINVSDAEKERFEERFGIRLINGYGSTEAFVIVTVTPLQGDQRWPSVGVAAFDRVVRIVDEQGNEVPIGTPGEICVKGVPGRTLMSGYHCDPQGTANTIRDGWLHTGDVGVLDAAGYLYFLGRSKDVIKRAGENISPAEVETVLMEHPDISLAAVIGVPDSLRDEAVKAIIVRRSGANLCADDVVRFCAERLATFKVPTFIEFRESLPTTPLGKVERRRLQEALSDARQV